MSIVLSLQEELQETRLVLKKCEDSRQEEVESRKEHSTQIAKLTEMKALLQQELEQTEGGSVADKQVTCSVHPQNVKH